MLQELDVVELTKEKICKNLYTKRNIVLPSKSRGTIVLVHKNSKLGRAYEVEFFDYSKKISAVITLTEKEIKIIK